MVHRRWESLLVAESPNHHTIRGLIKMGSFLFTEEYHVGPASVRIDVISSQPMTHVLEDDVSLNYRLGKVTRSNTASKAKPDLVWDRTIPTKEINFDGAQMTLTGDWYQGELQKILVSFLARRLEEAGRYLFHSSAVRYRQQSILFMGGESNHGKTMCQIEARRRGASIIATETTVIDQDGQVVFGSHDTFLYKRARGTERSDKPSQDVGTSKFFEKLPSLDVFYSDPTEIDIVILPDIDGHFDTAVKSLDEFERAYQTFFCLTSYFGLETLLAPGLPMPILDAATLRARRATFIQAFIQRPFYLIRASTPQIVLDEIERLI